MRNLSLSRANKKKNGLQISRVHYPKNSRKGCLRMKLYNGIYRAVLQKGRKGKERVTSFVLVYILQCLKSEMSRNIKILYKKYYKVYPTVICICIHFAFCICVFFWKFCGLEILYSLLLRRGSRSNQRYVVSCLGTGDAAHCRQ